MIKKKVIALALLMLGAHTWLKADEGMWLPMFIKRLNYEDMQQKGLQLTADEIYSVNHSSLKDAIVMLSGGSCTAEIISKEGLALTNHHCAFGAIQQNSTTDHDYLLDGFWAMNREQELPAEGMTASFLVRMENVTEAINSQLNDDLSEMERYQIIAKVSDSIENAAIADTHYEANVKSFFEGNEFYLFVYETFTDVRLVGAPPSSIGKYGGDTDNWMWPRHTGDFSLLRVYTGPDGKPAPYSENNIPLQPKHHLPVSMEGVAKEDFAMVMGYPGSTDRYLTSFGVKQELDIHQPSVVKIRTKRLELMKEDMDASQAVRIKYASKYASVANYWKYFIGQSEQLRNNKVYERKLAEEKMFSDWLNENPDKKAKYGDALPLISSAYQELDKYNKAQTYLIESALVGSEISLFAYRFSGLERVLSAEEPNAERLAATISGLEGTTANHFKDYNLPTDKKVTAALFQLFSEDVKEEYQPEVFKEMVKKNKGDFSKLAEKLFDKSIFATKESVTEFLKDPDLKTLQKDPAYQLAQGFISTYRTGFGDGMQTAQIDLAKGNRLFVAGLREMQQDRKFYPNANSTMRLTYGTVEDYYPRDAVHYNYYTTLEGVMQKKDNDDPEFVVPDKLVELYMQKDYGKYADKDGTMHVCFLTNNDITGGNSGSPVINAKGELIGAAFDGNWEAMSGDIAFETEKQRTIVVDIRYVLFIIDKYAGAKHLVDEMTLAYNKPEVKKAAPAGVETNDKAVPASK
ncbi:MAG: serine protease [Crocinitomicaceae bacterium]|nr:serine protease [Crocinitomicaceae bacterium]|tara:strand:- start:1327 stop:3564 length:2238 start_codon:yes stop_codon:yes gene_type:complete